jgi:threonine/homoserine/homoserine lactone efflux protein
MAIKILAGIVAVVLLAGFVLPYLLKMKSVALGVVILAGFAMVLWDIWESLRENEDGKSGG